MPYGIRKQECTDSSGEKGTHVVYKKDSGKTVSCHKSRVAAQKAIRARHANEPKAGTEPKDGKTRQKITFPILKSKVDYRLSLANELDCSSCQNFLEATNSCLFILGTINEEYRCNLHE